MRGRRGDRRLEAIEALYRERFAYFVQVARAITGDTERARDAVQDGFAAAIRTRASFRGEGSLEAWVWRIVVNAARDARRRRPALPEPPEPSTNGHAPVIPLDLLTERQREIVFLRYYADLDYRSIASALELEVGTVSSALAAAHATIRKSIRQVGADA
jgi:DNA-directed RNA polymerase specialized sigma24 family protein